ncbi:PucR family transcriptional regulator ligand-binding domain-containing protein [Pseudomonas sp. dw_358]|uniref:PucR family transcriptional regulator ligand-binding domain-containing protein n=1 Tax=Pseudomonas sp. dw_358 TaxID=2720083 RepID=UPI001BD32866|nr:PucR family transcriptional regulator ligand-binding domain-containing protein [Pseudomonas sp. dw_358]
MKLRTALQQTSLRQAKVVAGAIGLDRDIAWVQIVDHPEITRWLKKGDLLLTTGFNWPDEQHACRKLIRQLSETELAGIVLAVPRFHDCYPPGMLEEAQALGFPLMELPWEVAFTDITQDVLANIINQQAEALERSDRIHRALTTAALDASHLSALSQALTSALGLAAIITTVDGAVLSVQVSPTDSAAERALVSRLEQVLSSRELASDAQSAVIQIPDCPLKRWRVGAPVRLQGVTVAVVWLESQGHEFDPLHSRAVEHAAVIAALHLSHLRALQDQENRLGYALVSNLLEGKLPDTPQATERAMVSGWEVERDYRVCLILLQLPIPLTREGFSKRKVRAEGVHELMNQLAMAPLVSVSLNQISFIVPASCDPSIIWKALRSEGGAMAVSRVHRGIAGMAKGAADVAALVPMLRPGQLHAFNEVLFPRALMGDSEARDLLMERFIGPLVSSKSAMMLLDTLFALSREGFQLNNTAKALGVHISTLRYRVERIAELLDMSLEDPHTRFQLQVAAQMYQLEQEQAVDNG